MDRRLIYSADIKGFVIVVEKSNKKCYNIAADIILSADRRKRV